MIEVNYILIVVATIAQFILGALWYSPLMFGKWWQEVMGLEKSTVEEIKRMQQKMTPFYGLQFLLTLITTFVFAHLIVVGSIVDASFTAYSMAGVLWLGFIAPVQIASVVWGNTQSKHWLKQLSIMLGMQLVGIMLAAWILSFGGTAHNAMGTSMHDAMQTMSASLVGKTGDALDKAFLDEMIVHHQGAIEMAQTLLAGTKRAELQQLGNDIVTAQTKEIGMMQTWRAAWFGAH